MQCQADKNEHIRHNLLYEFNQDQNAAKAALDVYAVYADYLLNVGIILHALTLPNRQ